MRAHLTIAFIHGNCGAALMRRFLDSFAPLADLFIAVRAAGCAAEDDTREALSAAVPVVSYDYENGNSAEHWPHVDDFAAARNLAFDKAFEHGAEWVMWADTDDLISAEDCALIRSALESGQGRESDAVRIPYAIPGQGIAPNSVRIIRKGVARWQSPVHEHLDMADLGRAVRVMDIEARILHRPLDSRDPKTSATRNLRILRSIPEAARTPGLRFHEVQELALLGEEHEAAQKAADFLRRADSGPCERYEMALLLYMQSHARGAHAESIQWLTLAHATQPHRREALVELLHGRGLAGGFRLQAQIKPEAIKGSAALLLHRQLQQRAAAGRGGGHHGQ